MGQGDHGGSGSLTGLVGGVAWPGFHRCGLQPPAEWEAIKRNCFARSRAAGCTDHRVLNGGFVSLASSRRLLPGSVSGRLAGHEARGSF